MRLTCAWQSVYTDVSLLVPHRPFDNQTERAPKTRSVTEVQQSQFPDVAVVQDDGTLLDRNDEWILTKATRQFYKRPRKDDYHFVSFFPVSRPQTKPGHPEGDTHAYHVGVFNDIRGIGKGFRDRRHDYREGGSSRLDSVHLFPPLRELPEDPEARVDKDNNDNTLSLIAQEVGHRWSAFVWFRDRDRGGVPSSALLGRDRSHWNFFLETGGSPLEGNEWKKDEHGKDGALISSGRRGPYSRLDLYLMGLIPREKVEKLELLRHEEVRPEPLRDRHGAVRSTKHGAAADAVTPESRPKPGFKVDGAKKKIILIEDIIDFEGDRYPRFGEAPTEFRHAFALLLRRDEEPTPADVQKLNEIRTKWEKHFRNATENKGSVDTRL